jgi:2-phosphoglycerate kinase
MTEPRRQPFPLGGEDGLPYSKGLMARALMGGGVVAHRAYELALRVERDLVARGETAIDFERLHDLAVDTLGADEGARAVRRLRRFSELQHLDVPIILLIGGGTGTGKSTVATDAAHRLGITRVTSTDFVRQTMRAFFSKEFMPTIHYSSFEAGAAVDLPDGDRGEATVLGFLEQTRNVLVGVRAAIERALQEGWSMVLEGVHLVPGMVPAAIEGALVVHCILAVENEEVHASNFWIRDATSEGLRPVDKYIRALPDIRRVQDCIVERAKQTGVPVIDNGDVDKAILAVIELTLASAERVQQPV